MEIISTPLSSYYKTSNIKQNKEINLAEVSQVFQFDKESLQQIADFVSKDELLTPQQSTIDAIMNYARLKNPVH
ncbi:MAG: hypothetical protein M9887_07715 [Chitinophagales bacterium]|nr:hypothetical protein [Chitinophagales bacterium]